MADTLVAANGTGGLSEVAWDGVTVPSLDVRADAVVCSVPLVGAAATAAFAYGDAPRAEYTAPTGGARLVGADVSIRTPFDGTGPAILLGTTGANSADVLAATDTDPATAGVYSIGYDLPLSAGTTLTLSIAPGPGATAGAGVLTLYFA